MKKMMLLFVTALLLGACATFAPPEVAEEGAGLLEASSEDAPPAADASSADTASQAGAPADAAELAGEAETEAGAQDASPLDCPICDMDMSQYGGPLSGEEVRGLLMALNDEYHAWAVYDQVIQDFGQVRPFVNIQRAEATHMDALEALFAAYGLPVPENPWPGNVAGFESVQAACVAGVEAEILNAELYDRLFASTEREDILTVYRSLQAASNDKHLPAFQNCAG